MPSPFISVSRRRSRLRQSGGLRAGAAVAVVALLVGVVPAVAAPHAFSSAVSSIAVAKRALKLATGANKTAKKALKVAKQGPANNSVTTKKIADSSVTNEDLAPGAVGSGKIANGAIRNEDLAPGAVGSGKIVNGAIQTADIGDGQVTGIKITDGSVSTADLSGADITGAIHGDAGAIAAHSCTTAAIDLGGAHVGDAAFLTFIGDTPAPAGLTFQILKVSSTDHGTIRFCNLTNAASPAFSDVGIRVITFH
jgi:hypothetical protein